MSSEVASPYLLCKLLLWFLLMKVQYMSRLLAMLTSSCTTQFMLALAEAEVVY